MTGHVRWSYCLICNLRITLGRLLCFEHTRSDGVPKTEWGKTNQAARDKSA